MSNRLAGKVGCMGSSKATSVRQKQTTKKPGEYERKRNFDATPEPAPARRRKAAKSAPRFVIHEHHATRLHWDLRLEHDGALASWAVPNGIPENAPAIGGLAPASRMALRGVVCAAFSRIAHPSTRAVADLGGGA